MLVHNVGTLVACREDWASGAEGVGSAANITLLGNLERVRVVRNDAVGHSVSFTVNGTVAVERLCLVDGENRSLSTVGGELEGGSSRCVSTDNLLDWSLAVGKRSGISGLATKGTLWSDIVAIFVVRRAVGISDMLWSGVGSRSPTVRSTAVRSTTVSGSTVWGLLGSSVRETVLLVIITGGIGRIGISGVGLLSEAETTWAKVCALGRSAESSLDWSRATVGSTTESKTSTASVSATSGSAVGDLISTIVTGAIRGVVSRVANLLDWSSLLGISWQLAVA